MTEDLTPLASDSTRQATHTIAAYSYQIWRSVYRWIRLAPGEALYLEGAEDVDLLAGPRAEAIQVKAGGGNLTLASDAAIEAIINYWTHRLNNPDVSLSFRFLTLMQRGVERDSPMDSRSGLDFWDAARRGEVGLDPLRQFLAPRIERFARKGAARNARGDQQQRFSQLAAAEDLARVLQQSSDQDVREQLIRPIEWDTAAAPQPEVEQWVERLVAERASEQHQTAPSEARHIVPHLLRRAWDAAGNRAPRWLYLLDFLSIMEEVLTERVPKHRIQQYRALEAQVASGWSPAEHMMDIATSTSVFRHLYPLAGKILPRTGLVHDVAIRCGQKGIVVLHGSTGMGKSTVGLSVGLKDLDHWRLLDFRGVSPDQIRQTLLAASAVLSLLPAGTNILIDDLNFQDEPATYDNPLAEFVFLTLNRGGSIIITSQGGIPERVRTRSGLDGVEVVSIPPLQPSEVAEFAILYGCPPGEVAEQWGAWIHSTTRGHPQLVRARVSTLRDRNWPRPTAADLFRTSDIQPIRREARMLLSEDPGLALAAYRLSIFRSRFRRDYALIVASGSIPGSTFDRLVGPWIESVGANYYRASPLLEGAAQEEFPPSEVRALHTEAAEAIILTEKISTPELDGLLFHGIAGESSAAILLAARLIFQVPKDDRPRVFRDIAWIGAVAAEPGQRLVSADPGVSILARTAQFAVIEEVGPKSVAVRIAEAWDMEFATLPNDVHVLLARAGRHGFLTQVLNAVDVPIPLQKAVTWTAELLRLGLAGFEIPDFPGRPPPPIQSPSWKDINTIFVGGLVQRCRTRADVEEFLDALGKIDSDDAQRIFALFDSEWHLPIMLLDVAAVGLEGDTPDPDASFPILEKAAELGARMSEPLFAASYRGKATLLCERFGQPREALSVLDEALARLGVAHPVIEEYRARALFDLGEYAAAVQTWDRALTGWSGGRSVRLFGYRDAGIAAARIGKWSEAAQLFRSAEELVTGTTETAVGLRADRGYTLWKAGDRLGAVAAYAGALEGLETLASPRADLQSFGLHKLVGHAILWSLTQTREGEYASVGGVAEPIVGVASRPFTNEDIRSLPLQPIEMSWALLAQLEREVGSGDSVWQATQRKGVDSALPAFKFQMATEAMSRQLRAGRLDGLVRRAHEAHRAHRLARTHYQSGSGLLDEAAPAHPLAPPDDDEKEAIFNALVFGIVASDGREAAADMPLESWRADIEQLDLLSTSAEEWWSLLTDSRTGLPPRAWTILTDQNAVPPLRLLAAVLVGRMEHQPDRVFYAHLTLFVYLSRIVWNRDLEPAVERLVTTGWSRILEQYRIHLRQPRNSAPRISLALTDESIGFTKVARILLAAADAVNVSVATSLIETLRTYAAGELPINEPVTLDG